MKAFGWRQIGGDANPSQHGGLIARCDGVTIEVVEIQPVRAYVGDREALEVGFPFWTREATYWLSDLPEHAHIAEQQGVDLEDLDSEGRLLAIAELAFWYGVDTEEGPCGWAKDVLPFRVQWWGSKRPRGWRYLADEDQEFRALQREAKFHD